MNTQDTQSLNKSFYRRFQGKDNEKIKQLRDYVKHSNYIEIPVQPSICESFGLPYIKSIFEREYTERFINYLKVKPSSRFEVFKATGIPEKYLCQVKRLLEKKGKLQVLYKGYCEVSKKSNIQFLSTNPEHWEDSALLPMSNQKTLF
ncbi:hypothetical protein N1F78_11555 [Seonamhaeicola sp. MEBiC1930]|uniref:hypothetical protein n=1 Tax=Seonamhaeicola sp. MEBiC01930 TaxID=2976768 RepID=UPI00324D059E